MTGGLRSSEPSAKNFFPLASNAVPIKILYMGTACPPHCLPQLGTADKGIQPIQQIVVFSHQISCSSITYGFRCVVLTRNYRKTAGRRLHDYLGRALPA